MVHRVGPASLELQVEDHVALVCHSSSRPSVGIPTAGGPRSRSRDLRSSRLYDDAPWPLGAEGGVPGAKVSEPASWPPRRHLAKTSRHQHKSASAPVCTCVHAAADAHMYKLGVDYADMCIRPRLHTCASGEILCTCVHRRRSRLGRTTMHICASSAGLCTCLHNRRRLPATRSSLRHRHRGQHRRFSATFKPLTSALIRCTRAIASACAQISLISRLYKIREESLSRARGVVPDENVRRGPDRKHLLPAARLRQVVPEHQQGSSPLAAPQGTGHPQDPRGSVA